jgi:hypothetical protein
VAVTQKLTDLWQRRAGAEQFSCHSVAQAMCTDVPKPCATSSRNNDFAHPSAAKGSVGRSNANEDSTIYGRCRSPAAQIVDDGPANVYWPRYRLDLIALSSNENGAGAPVDVIDAKRSDFACT